jgi:hypothetical protein
MFEDLIQETEVGKIEKELLDGIEETGITQIERGLLDDMRISYLVMTAQLLGLRQGRDETLKQCQTIAEEKLKDEIKFLEEWLKEYAPQIFRRSCQERDIEDRVRELKQQLNLAQTKK